MHWFIRLFAEGLFSVISNESSGRHRAEKWQQMVPPVQGTWDSKFTDMNAQNRGCEGLRGGGMSAQNRGCEGLRGGGIGLVEFQNPERSNILKMVVMAA